MKSAILSILILFFAMAVNCQGFDNFKDAPQQDSDSTYSIDSSSDSSGFITQNEDLRYFYEPYPLRKGESILQLGLCITILPIPVVENEYPTPALDFQYKLGLFESFSLNATISTNFFGNLIHSGIQWNNNFGRFSYGVSQNIGAFFGFIQMEGQFDNNSAVALYYLPILRAGYRLDEFSFSISMAFSYIFSASSKVGSLSAVGIKGNWNDYFLTMAFEQPFLKEQLLAFGFSLNYSKTPYQSWLLYNTNEEYIYMPEFFFALQIW